MKFKSPEIHPAKLLKTLDGLAEKIPEDIARLLKKIALYLFLFFLVMAAYIGWTMGYGDNLNEGLKLAEDQKSLFREDIERDYNRKRKNINLSDIELEISRRAEERMLREEFLRSQNLRQSSRILRPSDKPLEDDASLYNQRLESPFPLPRISNKPSEIFPGKDESETRNLPILERMDSVEKYIETTEEQTKRLENTLDKLENLERKRQLLRPR